MQLVLSSLEEDGGGMVVVLGSFEGQVKGEAGSEVASLMYTYLMKKTLMVSFFLL